MDFEILPLESDLEKPFLANLNLSFGNWGDRKQFEWVYHRDCGVGAADLFLARYKGEDVGGTGVTYRRAVDAKGQEAKLAIMTGSWVLPAARGQGCFSRFVQTMIGAAQKRKSALLLGFAFKANKSYSRLLAAGFASIDTFYLRDAQEYSKREELAPLSELCVGDRSPSLWRAKPDDCLGFQYSLERWKEQFLGGPYPKAFLEPGDGSTALVEEAHGFLRVLALSLPPSGRKQEVLEYLLALAKSRHQRLFLFTMDPDFARLATQCGCELIPGAFILKIANREALSEWCTEAETVKEEELVDPEHPSYLGTWWFQNRDRM